MPTVTLKDIYEVVERLEAKMETRLCSSEKRINVLENYKAQLVGIWLTITAIISIGGSWLGQMLFKK